MRFYFFIIFILFSDSLFLVCKQTQKKSFCCVLFFGFVLGNLYSNMFGVFREAPPINKRVSLQIVWICLLFMCVVLSICVCGGNIRVLEPIARENVAISKQCEHEKRINLEIIRNVRVCLCVLCVCQSKTPSSV